MSFNESKMNHATKADTDEVAVYYIDPAPQTVDEAIARYIAYRRETGEKGDLEAKVANELAEIDPSSHLQYLIDMGDCLDAELQAAEEDATQAEIERAGILARMVLTTYYGEVIRAIDDFEISEMYLFL